MTNQLITHRLPIDVIDHRLVMSGLMSVSLPKAFTVQTPGGTPLYGLYRYVRSQRV